MNFFKKKLCKIRHQNKASIIAWISSAWMETASKFGDVTLTETKYKRVLFHLRKIESVREETCANLKFCAHLQEFSTKMYKILQKAYDQYVPSQSAALLGASNNLSKGMFCFQREVVSDASASAENDVRINTIIVIIRGDS